MKRVVHLTSAHRRYDQRILWRECYSLRENGYDVVLIVNDNQPDEVLDNGIRIMSTGFLPSSRWQRMNEGVNRVYEVGLKAGGEIYHLHDAELLTVALKLKRRGKKVIFDSHEFYGEEIKSRQYFPALIRNIAGEAYYRYETYVCRRIDGVIAVAQYDNKDMFHQRSKRYVYVNNYPRKSEFEKMESVPYNKRHGVCYSGALTQARGITNLVQAGCSTGAMVVLAGKFFSEAYKQEVLRNHVEYLGYIKNRAELYKMYSRCAIGAALIWDTGQFGKLGNLVTKVYEYMASSMPVVISDFPYNRKLIEKYHFGLVAKPKDVNDIASKIAWLLKHPQEAEAMGKNGKRLLQERFTWAVAEKELLKLYRQIA